MKHYIHKKDMFAIRIPGVVKYPDRKLFGAVLVVGQIDPQPEHPIVMRLAEIHKTPYSTSTWFFSDEELSVMPEQRKKKLKLVETQECQNKCYPFTPSFGLEEIISECGWAAEINYQKEKDKKSSKRYIVVTTTNGHKSISWLAKSSSFKKIASIIDHKYIPILVEDVFYQMGIAIEEQGLKFRNMIMKKILLGFEKCGVIFENREKYFFK